MDVSSLRRAGILGFVGLAQFTFCFELAEIYYPGYSVSANTISDLGATCNAGQCRFFQPSSDIFNASAVLLGVALIVGSYYLWKGSGSRSLPAFVLLSGIGVTGVGVFNESYGALHTFFSAFTFFAIGIQALLVFKVARPPFSYFSILLGVVTLAATLLYGAHVYFGLGQGGMERMVVYPVLIGGLAFNGYMMGRGDSPL